LLLGYWKGLGLALMLDLVTAAISGVRTTREICEFPRETCISQVFIAIDIGKFPNAAAYAEQVKATLADLRTSTPREEGKPVNYPGQSMMCTRRE
jgi:3-dehydro-L-gulonate 2-dehydrogenase